MKERCRTREDIEESFGGSNTKRMDERHVTKEIQCSPILSTVSDLVRVWDYQNSLLIVCKIKIVKNVETNKERKIPQSK